MYTQNWNSFQNCYSFFKNLEKFHIGSTFKLKNRLPKLIYGNDTSFVFLPSFQQLLKSICIFFQKHPPNIIVFVFMVIL